MTEFTRITVLGTSKKAELVIPSEEAIGAIIPSLMNLLGEAIGSVARPLALVRPTGDQLDPSLSAEQQEIDDGEVVRLLRLDSAPPPPEITDITEVVSDALGDRPDLWSSRHRRLIGVLGIAALTGWSGLLVALGIPVPALAVLAGAAALFLLLAIVLGRIGLRWTASALIAASIGLTPVTAITLTASVRLFHSNSLFFDGCFIGLFVWIILGLGVGAGLKLRAAAHGSWIGALFFALPLILLSCNVPAAGVSGITGALAVVACGLIPWYALSAAGLTGLDDQVSTGQRRRRPEVLTVIADAYSGMTWTTLAIAIPLGASGMLLAIADTPWSLSLAAAIAVVTALRTRAFPLAAQAVTLWITACAIALTLVADGLAETPAIDAGALAALALLCALAVGAHPSAHQRASLRKWGDFFEGLAVIAIVPLLLGVFNVYAELLATF